MSEESFLEASRRRFVATVAAVAGSSAVAGCSALEDVTDQEFEAEPVGLPEETREELALTEVVADSHTITREGEALGVEGEVTITNHAVAYGRDLEQIDAASEYRPTLLDSFVRQHNSDGYRGAVAIKVPNVWDSNESELMGEPTDGTAPTFVVPTGARAQELSTYWAFLMYPPETIPELIQDGTVPAGGGFIIPVEEFLPGPRWGPAENGESFGSDEGVQEVLSQWFVQNNPTPSVPNPQDLQVLVPSGEGPELGDVFGRSAEEMPGRRVEAGEDLQPFSPYLTAVPGEFSDHPTPEGADEVSWPAAMGGTNYGVGVLASPSEEAGDETVSPLAGMDFEELLASDQAGQMIPIPGTFDGEDQEIEWVSGPEAIEPSNTPAYDEDEGDLFDPGADSVSLLDEETELKTYGGVLTTYESASWLTFTHVARVAAEDVVIMVGSQMVPINGEFIEDDDSSYTKESITLGWHVARGAGFSAGVGTAFQQMGGILRDEE